MASFVIKLDGNRPLRAEVVIRDNIGKQLAEEAKRWLPAIKRKSKIFRNPPFFGLAICKFMVDKQPKYNLFGELEINLNVYDGILLLDFAGGEERPMVEHRFEIVEDFKGKPLADYIISYILAKLNYVETGQRPPTEFHSLFFAFLYQLERQYYQVRSTLSIIPARKKVEFREVKSYHLMKVGFGKDPLDVLPDGKMFIVAPHYNKKDIDTLNFWLSTFYNVKVKQELVDEFCDAVNDLITKARRVIYNEIVNDIAAHMMEIDFGT